MNQQNLLALFGSAQSLRRPLHTSLLFACWLMCLSAGAHSVGGSTSSFTLPPPAWSITPTNFQFNMNMVVRIRYDGVTDNTAGNMFGVFVGSELRGVATGTNVGGQMYYFVTVYSNIYTGEVLNFRTYYAPNDKVYASIETIVFTHHKLASTIDNPFWVNIDPALNFPPQLSPILADTTLQGIPFDPIDLTNYLNSPDGDPVAWTAQPGPNLTASIVNGVLTVIPVSPMWTGTDTVRIIVTETTPGNLADTIVGRFTVLPDYGAPVLQPIPNQSIYVGQTFSPFDLDNYLTFNGPCRAFDFDVFPYTGAAVDPAWPNVPPGPQPMSVVARPLFADEVLAGPAAKLAAFVNGTLVGTASPVGTPPNVSYSLLLKNAPSAPITFRFYHAENQYLYEKTTTLLYSAGASVGSVAAPFQIQFSPLVPTLTSAGAVQVNIADPAWLGTYPVDFIVWDCNFPNQRRDTVRVTFSVVPDIRPRITSPTTAVFTEKSCNALYDAQTTDPQDSEGSGLTYSIAGGTDAARFSIHPVDGKLSWATGFEPDFELPADANTDNVYEVVIRVTNSANVTDEITLLVTVADNSQETFLPQVNGGITAVCLVGTVVLQASGGNTYQWSNADLSSSITVNMTGTYTVTITNAVGCSAVITVTVSNKPSITASGSSVPVCLGSNINLGSTPTGGSGTYTTFAWAGPNSFSSSLEDPLGFPATPAAAGVYTVSVTDNAGCTATATTSIAVAGNSAPSITANNNGPLCAGANLILNSMAAGGSTPYTQYRWSGPNNFSAPGQAPGAFPSTVVAGGTYTVTVTDNAGCTATGSTTVVVNALPTIVAMNSSPVCLGSTVSFSSTPGSGTAPYVSFSWVGPNLFSSNVEDPPGISPSLVDAGTYTVTVTDSKGCTNSATTSVVVNPVPSITATTVGAVCVGGTLSVGSTPIGGSGIYSSFNWAGPNGFTASVEDPAAIPAIPAAAGTYTVTVIDNKGCASAATATAVIDPVPTAMAANTGPVCQGGNIMVSSTAGAGTPPYLFQWTGPDAYVASVEDPVAFSTTSASSGVYQIKVTDNKGCTATATTQVVVNPKPVLTATSNSPVCIGANIHLQSNPTNGSGVYSTYSWTGPNGFTASAKDPVRTSATLLHTGTYSVTVTDNAGCSATASTSVAVSTLAAPTITPNSNAPLCGGSLLNLTSAPSGGSGTYSSFKWAGPNGFSQMVQNPPGFAASALSAGVYTVSVTDNRGCIGTNTLNVVVNAPAANPNTNSPICESTVVQLNANPSGSTGIYTNFSWQGPNGYTGMGQMPATFVASASTIGTYTVTVTDNLGCTATGTVAVSYGINAPPSITCPADQQVPTVGNTCAATVGNWVSSATNVMDDCTPLNMISVNQMPAANTPISGHDTEVTVTLTAMDGTGNSTPCTFKVKLKDQTPPSITCPATQAVGADANCAGQVGNRIALATGLLDNCAATGNITVTQSPDASTPLSGHNDTETITLTAHDGNGNSAPCMFTVILKDQTPPTAHCPSNIVKSSDLNLCSAVTTYTVTASDNCTGVVPSLVSGLASGQAFPVGVNIVVWKATDVGGNENTCQFTVTVNDTQVPSITCPLNITRNTDFNLCTAVVTYSNPAFSDNCPGSGITRTDGLASGSAFPKGVNTVNWKVTDASGLTAICNFTVTVVDAQAPSITCPANIVRNTDLGLCSAVVTYTPPTSSDNCPGVSQSLISGGASGTVFERGVSSVTWQAIDAVGLTTRCTFTITVNDNERPTISCPSNQTKTTDLDLCTAVSTYTTPTFTDNCPGGSVSIQSGLVSGSAFPKGITTVVWRATDASNNTRTCSFRITVNDVQAPSITCPANIVKNTDLNLCTAVTTYANATFTDNCTGGSVVRISGPQSGSAFPKTTTSVVFRATDASGNTALCTMTVTVIDAQLPSITCPSSVSVTAPPGQCSMVVDYNTPTGSDNCVLTEIAQITGLVSGSVFPQGATVNVWQATDNSGLTQTCSFSITVACGTGPSGGGSGVATQVSTEKMAGSAIEDQHPVRHSSFTLAPNPAGSEVLIQVENVDDSDAVLTIFDGLGRLMWETTTLSNIQSTTVNLMTFPAGVYFVTLRSEGAAAVTKRLVVSR